MSETSNDRAVQLRFEFYKSFLTFQLATLGGTVTLLYALLKNAPLKAVAYVCVLIIAFSCLCTLASTEVLITRINPFPTPRGLLDKLLSFAETGSPTAERVFGFIAGALYGFGLVMFTAYLIFVSFLRK